MVIVVGVYIWEHLPIPKSILLRTPNIKTRLIRHIICWILKFSIFRNHWFGLVSVEVADIVPRKVLIFIMVSQLEDPLIFNFELIWLSAWYTFVDVSLEKVRDRHINIIEE